MKRRAFIQTLGAAAAGAGGLRLHPRMMIAKRLDRIGLELYAVRHEMAKDPEKTLAAIRAIGYTDVELLWSFDNFHRTAAPRYGQHADRRLRSDALPREVSRSLLVLPFEGRGA